MRPTFHFTDETGWINDPHGITVKDGNYHLFYQYVPGSTVWAPNCHWGHAQGPDLFSLERLPVAIAPGEGDDGIWTGSLVTDGNGESRIFYTSTSQPNIGIGHIRVATPTDDSWVEWTKGAFVAEVPEGLDIIAYRDPFLLKEASGWRMFVGAGLSDGTAMALSYTSADLDSWEYEGVALQRSTNEREPVWMGALWECPQIFEIDGAHAMVSSVWDDDVLHYAGYAFGDYSDGKFDAESWGRLTYGPSYYAPSFFRDANGQPCLTFWMRGVEDAEAGWASAHSVPHVLTIAEGRLVSAPHPDIEKYRGEAIADGVLPGLAGDIVWSASADEALTVTSAGKTVFTAAVEAEQLVATVGTETFEVPYFGGDVRIIMDAQAVEISSPGGMLGFAVIPEGETFEVTAAKSTVYPLER